MAPRRIGLWLVSWLARSSLKDRWPSLQAQFRLPRGTRSIPTRLSVEMRPLLSGHLDLFGEVPTPMDASLGSIRIFHFEVPVHMTSLLFFALGCGIKAATARSADVGLRIVESRNEVQTGPVNVISIDHCSRYGKGILLHRRCG